MAINLTKNNPISLTKTDPGLKKLRIGLGWDADLANGGKVDLDLSLFLTDDNKRTLSDKHMIYFNPAHSKSLCGAVEYHGDNKTGVGESGTDKETADIDLPSVSADVKRISVCASIHDFHERNQNFGLVKNAYLRVVNAETNVEIGRAQLTDSYPADTALVMGEVYRTADGGWDFNIVSQGYANGLGGIVLAMGLDVE